VKAVCKLKQKINAMLIRRRIMRERKKHGLSTDPKELVEKYRTISPEYAEELERLIYPS